MITKTNERLKRPFLKNCFIVKELSNPARENSRRHLNTADENNHFGTHSFVLTHGWRNFIFTHVLKFACYSNSLFTRTIFKSTLR